MGIRHARALQEASCVPAAFGSDIPTLDLPFLCPAGVVRVPDLPGSLCPETHLGAASGSCRAATPSCTLLPGQVFSAGDYSLFYPSNKLNWRTFSHGPSQSLPTKRSHREPSTWQFYILLFSLQSSHQNPQLQGHFVIEGERAEDLSEAIIWNGPSRMRFSGLCR